METDGGEFGETYWTADSTYSQFDGYQAGLDATRRWYQGLWRYVARHFPEPCKAIDVGCGYGAITLELHSRGFDVTGLDTSEWMVTQATNATQQESHVSLLVTPPTCPKSDMD